MWVDLMLMMFVLIVWGNMWRERKGDESNKWFVLGNSK